jgi:hypothetical protein
MEFSSYLEFRKINKIHKPCGSECYEVSSEAFRLRVYLVLFEWCYDVSKPISCSLSRRVSFMGFVIFRFNNIA